MIKLLKVIAIRDEYMEGGHERFCTKGREYNVIKGSEYDGDFDIRDDSDDEHTFTVGDCDWFKLVYETEQINNNSKENVIMDKLKVGDRVKVIKEPGMLAAIEIGDSAVIDRLKDDIRCEIKVDKTGNHQTVYRSSLELITKITKDIQKLKIITEGTTTTVRFKDGREGVAKLWHKDTYNKGFGIVQALGAALDIDLVGEVVKVVESYKTTDAPESIGKGLSSVKGIVDKIQLRIIPKFKVGDYIYYKSFDGTYDICKISKVDENKIWGNWSRESFKNTSSLPKTRKEFELIKRDTDRRYMSYVNTKDNEVKKLILIDDTKPKYKVGDKVTRKVSIELIKAGYKIREQGDWIYFEENGILKYKTNTGKIAESIGYRKGDSLAGTLKVESLPESK